MRKDTLKSGINMERLAAARPGVKTNVALLLGVTEFRENVMQKG